jgi:hypothetical protein
MSGTSDVAKVSVQVKVSPAEAFEIFTLEIDQWWKQGPAYRIGGRSPGELRFEPGPSGRLFETYRVGGELRTVEIGKVTIWDPPRVLAFEWRGINYRPGESTVVEVRFLPQGAGTLVSVEHRGWSALPDDHPARHGAVGAAFIRNIGLWWGGLLTALRAHAAARTPKAD